MEKTCSLCGMPSTQFDLAKGQHVVAKHPGDVTGIICSKCMQILLGSTQAQIKCAYQKALDAGLPDKAKALENLIEEEQSDRETKSIERDLVRKRALRTARSPRHQIRT